MELRANGKVVSRCDGRCTGAKSDPSTCHCCCGGSNHGRGEEKAVENTMERGEQMLLEFAEANGLDEYDATIGREVLQASLFDFLDGDSSDGSDR